MTQIANQAHVIKQIKNLFQERKPPQRSPLTPTQHFIVETLRKELAARDGKGSDQFQHWELRKLKETRTILLASVIGKIQRYILIGPRGLLTPIDDKAGLSNLELDETIPELGNA